MLIRVQRAKGREVHLDINHQYLLLCEDKYHPPVLYKTHHGSYRKIFQKLVRVQLLPGQAVLPLASSVIAIPIQSNMG